jgi:hypothetical protein
MVIMRARAIAANRIDATGKTSTPIPLGGIKITGA